MIPSDSSAVVNAIFAVKFPKIAVKFDTNPQRIAEEAANPTCRNGNVDFDGLSCLWASIPTVKIQQIA